MSIRIKLNNPNEEFGLGIYCHRAESLWKNEETGEIDEDSRETVTRLVLGFLVFNIDIIW